MLQCEYAWRVVALLLHQKIPLGPFDALRCCPHILGRYGQRLLTSWAHGRRGSGFKSPARADFAVRCQLLKTLGTHWLIHQFFDFSMDLITGK